MLQSPCSAANWWRMSTTSFTRLVLSTSGLFETRRRLNCTAVALHRDLLTDAQYRRNHTLTEPNGFFRTLLIEQTMRRRGVGEAFGCTRVNARCEKESFWKRSVQCAGARELQGLASVGARWERERWFPTFSSTRGGKGIFHFTNACVQRCDDQRGCGNVFFRDYRRTYRMMDSLGSISIYACAESQLKNAGCVRVFHRTCSMEVRSTCRRSRNLEIFGQNYATNERVLSEIVRILQEDKKLEVVKLGESCHVRLLVRRPESDVFLGISAKGAKVRDAYGRYQFAHCRKDHNIINLCASLPSLKNHSFRWWLIPGENLRHLQSGRVNVLPAGKWGCFEISQDELANAISDEVTRRIAYQVSLTEWSVPKSPTHQKELEYFSQMTQKVWAPLACGVTDPLIAHSSVDVVIDGIHMQNKTAYEEKGSRGLRIDTRKQGGRDAFGKCTTQPYAIDDDIDAIAVNVQTNGTLVGLFVFPKKEIVSRGWFRGMYHSGKVAVHVFPPYLSPRKGYESKQHWQLEYYLDLSSEVDLKRARMLLDQCKKEKPEIE